MKLTLNSNRFNKQIIPTSCQLIQQAIDQNPNFTDNYLKQQIFYKPQSDYGEHNSSSNYKQTSLLNAHKRPLNGMGNSFMSGHSSNKLRSKEQESYKKMIIELSHQLLVKDEMIDSLRCELMSNQVNQSASRTSEEEKQTSIKNKSSYHFKTLIEGRGFEKDLISRKKSFGRLSTEDKKNSEIINLEQKATLSQSQFIKFYGKDIEESFNKKSESSRFNIKNSNQKHRTSQLEQKLRMKERQLQVVLTQKKMLTQKIVENQRLIISKDAQIKTLKTQLKKADTSKDQINKSIDNKRVIQYEERINRLKKENLFLSTHIDQIKKSKGQQIQSSIKQWKKINQTMTDSLIKLNQQNSVLTKKITDLQVRLTTSCTKTSELEKQNSTLKYNLQNQKNSYSTLSMHHKHQKDQSNRRIAQLQKEIEKLRQKSENYRIEKEKSQSLIKQKQESLKALESQLLSCIQKHESQMNNLKESHIEQLKHERELKKLIQKDLEISASSLKNIETQMMRQREYKSSIQKQLTSSIKIVSQYKSKQLQKNEEVQHYKNKVSELIQKVSELRIQRIHQGGKQKDNTKKQDIERQQALFENQSLKYKIEQLTKQINQDPQSSVKFNHQLQEQTKRRQELEEINKKLGQKIRKSQQQILSLKSRIKQSSSESSEYKSENDEYHQTQPLNYNNVIDHNHILTQELNQRQHVIYDLRENLRRQQDNTINLKLHLDDVNKKLNVYTELLQSCNRLLIVKQLHFGNCTLQAQEAIDQLKQDNQELEKELKVIYQRLEYFEQKLECESSEIDIDSIQMFKKQRAQKEKEGQEEESKSINQGDDSMDQNSYNSD